MLLEMFDTIAIKHYLARPPTEDALHSLGWLMRFNKYDGRTCAFIRNEQDSTEPRLTLSLNPKSQWHLKAEASLSKLLRGVNVPLLGESEIETSLRLLATKVEEKIGIKFDPNTALVCRADFARDLYVGETAVVPIIAKLMRVQIPRYDRTLRNDESVVFTPKGASKGKRISVYDKLAEVIQRNGSEEEQRNARGILRLEVGLKTKAITYLTRQLKLPNREAQHIMTREVADYVLQDALQKLQFDAIDSNATEVIQKLISEFGTSRAKNLLGFMEIKKQFGEEFYKDETLNYSRRTYFRDLADCRKAGVLP